MISLSQTSGYAVLALGCIGSWKGDWVRSDQIHACTGVPRRYLMKLLFALGKAGLVQTKRGSRGGYVLARPPGEITLLEIAEAVEPTRPGSDCLLGLVGCSDATPCPMHAFWKKELPKIRAELARTSLAKAAKCIRKAQGGKLTTCPDETYVPKCPQLAETAQAKKNLKSKSASGKRRQKS